MKKIRLAIVGYGFRGPSLLRAARSTGAFELLAVCDEDPAVRDRAEREAPGVTFFDDAEEMLSSGLLEAVLIETPPATHARLAIAALGRGVHVYSDVPAVHSIEEAQPLWEAARASQTVYMLGNTGNYFGFVQTCDDLKEKGLLGKPFYLEAEYIHDLREFSKATPWRIGYEPIRYCTHSLGPLLAWLGGELASVSCLGTGSHVRADGGDGHDAMVAIFKAATGEVVKLLVSFTNSNVSGLHRYLCHGTRGIFECTWPLTGQTPKVAFSIRGVHGFEKTIEVAVPSDRPELATLEGVSGHGSLDFAMLRDFAAAVGGAPCRIGLKEALRMTLPGLFALRSAERDGQRMDIRYPWS